MDCLPYGGLGDDRIPLSSACIVFLYPASPGRRSLFFFQRLPLGSRHNTHETRLRTFLTRHHSIFFPREFPDFSSLTIPPPYHNKIQPGRLTLSCLAPIHWFFRHAPWSVLFLVTLVSRACPISPITWDCDPSGVPFSPLRFGEFPFKESFSRPVALHFGGCCWKLVLDFVLFSLPPPLIFLPNPAPVSDPWPFLGFLTVCLGFICPFFSSPCVF